MADDKGFTVRECSYPSRIGTGEMIGPQKEAVRADTKNPTVLGVIWGEARGLSYRNNTQNPEEGPAVALIGAFEFTPSEPKRPLLRAGTSFLPRTIHDMVCQAVRGKNDVVTEMPKRGARVNQIGVSVPIAFEVSAIGNDSSVGYKFDVRELVRVSQNDPMAAIRGQLGGALDNIAPPAPKLAITAPEKGKKTTKKK